MAYVLDKERHGRLISDLQNIAYTAGIPTNFIEHSMVGIGQDADINWIKNFRTLSKESAGVIFFAGANPESRMMAACGALVRNYIDARCVTLKQVIDGEQSCLDATVLFILNFYTTTHGGKALTSWQIQQVYDLLMQRLAGGKQTGVFVEDINKLGQDYGKSMFDHLKAHYTLLRGVSK